MRYIKPVDARFILRSVVCLAVSVAFAQLALHPLQAQDDKIDQILSQEDDRPLVDQDPHDIIVLDNANDFERLKVARLRDTAYTLSLPIPERPYDFDDRGTLKFQLLEFQEKYWQVPWQNITEIKLFDELLMEEAQKLLDANDFDLCFRTLLFLKEEENKDGSLELRQMFDKCLAADGKQSLQDGRYDDALSIYEELFFRNPRYQSGAKSALDIVTECYDRLVEAEVNANDFLDAQHIVQIMDTKYGDRMRDAIDKWNGKIDEAAIKELGRVREIVGQNNSDEAHKAVRRLVYVMPRLLEGHQMFKEVAERFPHVYVGVTQPAIGINPAQINSWSSRRLGRLTHRWLFEFEGLGDDGGKYNFPNGSFTRIDDLGLQYRIEIDDTKDEFGVPPISTYEISNRLLEMADDKNVDYYIPWARVLKSVEIDGDKAVIINLKSPYVRPEALLQTSYMRSDTERYKEENGKYNSVETKANDSVFKLNQSYQPIPEHQHPTIVERTFPTASLADEALIEGNIDVVDRIYPSDYDRLLKNPEIEVRAYGIPTVHVLIPNERNLHMKNVSFRRSLTYAVDRKSLVLQYISNGRLIDGFTAVSGPFPPGSDKTEEIAYANNPSIKPRPKSGELAIVLAALVEEQERMRIREERDKKKRMEMQGLIEPEEDPAAESASDASPESDPADENEAAGEGEATEDATAQDGVPGESEAKKKEEPIVVPRPTFILAHPDNELVENLCNSMVDQWALIEVKVTLRKLPPGILVPEDDDYDLLYMELFMQEPMVDAYQLFGNEGIVTNVDATIKQALWLLDEADSWSEVAASLRRIHQQSFNNMTIIPLWQIMDHYAYRTHMHNIGNKNVHLYQNVENWSIAPTIPVIEEEE